MKWFEAENYTSTIVQHQIKLVFHGAHFVLFAAVAVGVAGGICSSPENDASTQETGLHLSTAARSLFFFLTGSFLLASIANTFRYLKREDAKSFGNRKLAEDGMIFILIGILLNIKTIFSLIADNAGWILRDEHLLYSCWVLPELLILCVYFVPGVVTRYRYSVQTVGSDLPK